MLGLPANHIITTLLTSLVMDRLKIPDAKLPKPQPMSLQSGDINDPPIEPVYPIETLLLLLNPLTRAFRSILSGVEGLVGGGGGDDLNQGQYDNLQRFEKKLPTNAGQTKIISNNDGSKVFQSDVPANNIPGSYARYEKTVDAAGNTIKYTKTTYGPKGNIIHVKDKFP